MTYLLDASVYDALTLLLMFTTALLFTLLTLFYHYIEEQNSPIMKGTAYLRLFMFPSIHALLGGFDRRGRSFHHIRFDLRNGTLRVSWHCTRWSCS